MQAPPSEALFAAIDAGAVDTVERLLAEHPSDAHARDAQGLSALLHALYCGQSAIAEMLVQALGADSLDVHEAAAVGAVDRLRTLVQADRSLVNAWSADGFSPLQLAAFFGHRDAMELLLQSGADVSVAARHPFGVTALHAALASPVPNNARLLIDAGSDVNARQQHGFTPLHTTAQNGDPELTRLLLARGADPTARTDDGRTPRDLAVAHNHDEVAALL
jgi:ankyrin repeat protein